MTIMLEMDRALAADEMWERRWNALNRMYAHDQLRFADRDGDWSLRDFIDYAGQVCGFCDSDGSPEGGDACGSVHDSAVPTGNRPMPVPTPVTPTNISNTQGDTRS